jgi:hypothetical protein
MINGAHVIIYSTNADADRTFLKDVLALPSVDVGGGWLIFGLPPAEVAVHPHDQNGEHELYLMCDDVEKLIAQLGARGLSCDPISNQGWGLLTNVTLPGGSKLGIYQPRHARPPQAGSKTTSAKKKAAPKKKPAPAKKAAKKAANKKPAKKKKR